MFTLREREASTYREKETSAGAPSVCLLLVSLFTLVTRRALLSLQTMTVLPSVASYIVVRFLFVVFFFINMDARGSDNGFETVAAACAKHEPSHNPAKSLPLCSQMNDCRIVDT